MNRELFINETYFYLGEAFYLNILLQVFHRILTFHTLKILVPYISNICSI